MPNKATIARNEKRRRLVEKYKEKRARLKAEGNWEALDRLPKNSSPVRVRNRCRICGRGRGYIRLYGLCRIHFRELAASGQIPGIRKASW